MANFISIALGEGEYTRDETEKLNIKVPEPTKSIPMELIRKIDKEEAEYYEKLKLKEVEESEQFFGLKADIKSFDDYDKMQSGKGDSLPLNAGVPEVGRLKVIGPKTDPYEGISRELRAELLPKLEQSVKEGLNVETLPKAASDSLKTLVDSLDELNIALQKRTQKSTLIDMDSLEMKSEDSNLNPVENLEVKAGEGDGTEVVQLEKIPNELISSLETTLLEFKNQGLVSEGTYEKLHARFENINNIEPNIESLAGSDRLALLSIISNLKTAYNGWVGDVIKYDSPTGYEGGVIPLNKGDNPETSSSPNSNFWDVILGADKSSIVTLSSDLLASMYEAIGLPRSVTQKMKTAVDTLSSRFGITDFITNQTGITYNKYSEFLDYAMIAAKINKGITDGGVIEISTENLIFAATFAAFLEPIELKAPTTRNAGNSKADTVIRGFTQAASGESKPDDASFFHSENIDNLPFKGYESVRGIELFDQSHWDLKLEKIKVSDITGNPSNEYLTKVSLPRFNKDWWVNAKEIEEGAWLPVNQFSINLTQPNYNQINPIDILPLQVFDGMSYPMNGTLEFMETNSLWLKDWMRRYCIECYPTEDGMISQYTFYEMCYKLSIYIWDAFEATKKKDIIYKNLYKNNGNPDDPNDPNGPKFRSGNYMRKYVLYILPQMQGENWTGTPTPSLIDKTTLQFSVVGGEGLSMMMLDQATYKTQG